MYNEHSSFEPISDETKIWRFMDLAKFCDILEKSSIFFVKPEKFPDPWEGFSPRKHFEESSYENIPLEFRKALIKIEKEDMPKMLRGQFAVSCWHINGFESEAFWRNYSKRGIALQSTFGRLKESLRNTHYSVFIGKVKYKNHDTDIIDSGNLFNRILWKRKSFEYEKELRAVIWNKHNPDGKGVKDFRETSGEYIDVDLNILIEKIYTTPFENDNWFNNVVNDVIKRYKYKFECIKSQLMDTPL